MTQTGQHWSRRAADLRYSGWGQDRDHSASPLTTLHLHLQVRIKLLVEAGRVAYH